MNLLNKPDGPDLYTKCHQFLYYHPQVCDANHVSPYRALQLISIFTYSPKMSNSIYTKHVSMLTLTPNMGVCYEMPLSLLRHFNAVPRAGSKALYSDRLVRRCALTGLSTWGRQRRMQRRCIPGLMGNCG